MFRRPTTRTVTTRAALICAVFVAHCASPERPAPDAPPPDEAPPEDAASAPAPHPPDGLPACADGARIDLRAAEARECWFTASHGQWRIVDYNSHYDSVVVTVRATDPRDAQEIATDFVERGDHLELLVYVHPEVSTEPSLIQRVRWTRLDGFDTLEFEGPPHDTAK